MKHRSVFYFKTVWKSLPFLLDLDPKTPPRMAASEITTISKLIEIKNLFFLYQ
jgi:hypothetical protein